MIEEPKPTDATSGATTDEEAEIAELSQTEEYLARQKARKAGVDDGDGAHGGGLGASGSAVDFGKPANYTGIDGKGL